MHMNIDSDLSLSKVIGLLKKSWKLLVIAPLLVCLSAYLLITLQAPKWDGKATLQVGQIGQGELIESLPLSQIRLQAYSQSLSSNKHDDINLSIKVIDEKFNLFEISVKANSQKAVQKGLSESINYMKMIHLTLSSGDLLSYKENLKQKKIELNFVNKEINDVMNMLKYKKTVDSMSALGIFLLSNLRSERNNVEKVIQDLENRLSHQNTFPTQMIGLAEIPNSPTAPKKRMAILLAFFLSTLASIFFVLIRGLVKK